MIHDYLTVYNSRWKNECWRTLVPPGATKEETAAILKSNLRAQRNARAKATKAATSGLPVPPSQHTHAAAAGVPSCRGGLFLGGDDGSENIRLAQKNFSQKVSRAERPTAEQEKVNSERSSYLQYKHVIKGGDVDAQHDLTCACWHGENGAKMDRERALELYHRAAQGGHAHAQWKLGSVFHHGEKWGPEQVLNEEEALFWYKKAAEEGHAYAQWELGAPTKMAC